MTEKRKTNYDAFLAAMEKMGEVTDYSCMVEGLSEGAKAGLTLYGNLVSDNMKHYRSEDPKEKEKAFFKIVSAGLMSGILAIKTLLEATPDEWARKYLAFITTNLSTATAVHSGVVADDDLDAISPQIALLSPETVRGILGDPAKEKTPQEGVSEEEIMNLPEGFMEGLQKYLDKGGEGEVFHKALGEIFRRS